MKIPAKVREGLYIALAIIAAVLAVIVVFFGWITTEQVKEWASVAVLLYAVFIGVLAKLNVTPDLK